MAAGAPVDCGAVAVGESRELAVDDESLEADELLRYESDETPDELDEFDDRVGEIWPDWATSTVLHKFTCCCCCCCLARRPAGLALAGVAVFELAAVALVEAAACRPMTDLLPPLAGRLLVVCLFAALAEAQDDDEDETV